MTITNLLEDFSTFEKTDLYGSSSEGETFDLIRLEGFDSGYKAGWDDATEAVKATSGSISEALGENLSNFTFTYHDARAAVLNELAPVIKELTQSVLPKVLHSSFSAIILETIEDIADKSSNPAVHLRVHPAHADTLTKALDNSIDMPFDVVADLTLGEDATLLEIGKTELEIDFTEYFEKISQTLLAFFAKPEVASKYG